MADTDVAPVVPDEKKGPGAAEFGLGTSAALGTLAVTPHLAGTWNKDVKAALDEHAAKSKVVAAATASGEAVADAAAAAGATATPAASAPETPPPAAPKVETPAAETATAAAAPKVSSEAPPVSPEALGKSSVTEVKPNPFKRAWDKLRGGNKTETISSLPPQPVAEVPPAAASTAETATTNKAGQAAQHLKDAAKAGTEALQEGISNTVETGKRVTSDAAQAVTRHGKNIFANTRDTLGDASWKKPGLAMKSGGIATKAAIIVLPIAAAIGTAAAVNSFRNREDSRRAEAPSADVGRA